VSGEDYNPRREEKRRGLGCPAYPLPAIPGTACVECLKKSLAAALAFTLVEQRMLIDPYHTNWHAELMSQSRRLPNGAQLVLLIDGAFVPGLFRHLSRTSEPALLFGRLPGFNAKVKTYCHFWCHSLRAISHYIMPGTMRGTTNVERDCY
jgi:hypothetical protein